MFSTFLMKELSLLNIPEKSKEIDGREYPSCTNSKGIPPKQVIFGGSSRKLYNNIVVSDDEDEDEPEVDDLFLNGDDEEPLPDFENIENLNEDEE